MDRRTNGETHNYNMRTFSIYIIPLILYAVIILYVSLLPVGNEPPPEAEPDPSDDNNTFTPEETKPAETMLYFKYNVPLFDILANFLLYTGFGFLLYRLFAVFRPFRIDLKEPDKKELFYRQLWLLQFCIGIALLYSSLNEYAQRSLASRVPDVSDIVFNTLGAASGAAVLFIKNQRNKTPNLKIDK